MMQEKLLKRARQGGAGWARGGGRSSFSVLLLFVAAFAAVVIVAVGVVAEVHFVHGLECLGEIVLQGGDCGAHSRAAEAVRDEVEVGQAALDARLQNGGGPRVPQGRSVLSQQVGELLADLSAAQMEQREGKGERGKGKMSQPCQHAAKPRSQCHQSK